MRARVWNRNDWPHTEKFKEEMITIPPGGFVEMDYEDAIQFKGQFTVLRTDGEKNPLPQFRKIIKVEKILDGSEGKPVPLICHATGKVAESAEELAKMNAEHVGILDPDSAKELEEQAKLRAENEELKARLAALEAGADKRGPGRPRKQA